MNKSTGRITVTGIYLLTVLIINVDSAAQGLQNIKPLRRGDTIPDYVFSNVINHSNDTLKLSRYRQKLIILDFWGTGCTSCIRAFPKIDSLQKLFANSIQIILVNRESKDSTLRFFEKRKRIKMPAVPFITGDKLLVKLFSIGGVPYHVWIQDGVVKYIAESQYATGENISRVLERQKTDIPDRKDNMYVTSFFNEEWENSLQYYSYISGCNKSVHLESGDPHRITFGCKTILELYQIAFNGLIKSQYYFDRPGRTFVQTTDSSRFFRRSNESYNDWMENYRYNYQLMVPGSMMGEIYSMMKDDLDRFFKLEAKIVKKETTSYVLVKTGKVDMIATKGGKPNDNFFRHTLRSVDPDSVRYYYNLPFTGFSSRLISLVEHFFGKPCIDMVKYTGNIDITIRGEVLDFPTVQGLRKELRRFNLDLVEKKLLLDVLIIKSK